MFASMISSASAIDTDFEWIKSYFSNNYPVTEGYKIESYSFDKDNKVVVAKVNKAGMQFYATGKYDEVNSSVAALTWVRTYISSKYPPSQNYVIEKYSFNSDTKIVKVEVSKDGETFPYEIQCTVVSNGKGYIE